ncbi:MAG: hypothetical protein ACT4OW_00460 [Nitrososphaerota archaeon]
MQDPNPLPWGAQERFQGHFIVKKDAANSSEYVAQTVLATKGHFGSKIVTDVKWDGGKLAKILNDDSSLKEMITKQSPKNATIFVEPTENAVRIYGKWKTSYEFEITKELFEIYNKIAGHIKRL